MKYNYRLKFAYYSITFWDFKSLQSVPKTWQVVKTKNNFFERCPNIEIPFFMISNPDFSLFFTVITVQAPSSVQNIVSRPCFSRNLEISYWKSWFPVHRQILSPPFKYSRSMSLFGWRARYIVKVFLVVLSIFFNSSTFQLIIPALYLSSATA